ncbi:MAG: phosphoenolpyruvate mutase [Thermodesulfobacteriota bacterium]
MPNKKTTVLKNLLTGKELSFLMEAHNGISAKIVEEAGFEGIWGGGLCISAAMGVRDSNEATWTQILEVVEFMSDVTTIPILLDGDTGYGDFNTVRRLVKKLEQRNVAGLCIEDKLFPKRNSFLDEGRQELADIDEFCGKIKAAKDSQQNPDFCVVARVEALIAGWGLGEALKRAEAYYRAGADAILIHSKQPRANEIIEFMKEWGDTCPVVIVPTKYYSTPTKVFEEIGISTVIWANHLLRSSILTMRETAKKIYKDRSVMSIEDQIASVVEIFRLQGSEELQEAEKIYLPNKTKGINAVILAASRGEELGSLTEDRPKAMIPIGGKPLLHRMIGILNEIGIKNIAVVRGYRKEMITASNITYIDNDDYANSKEVYSLYLARNQIHGDTLISFGDILYKKYIPMNILEEEGDIGIVVDSDWQESRNRGRYADYVCCNRTYHKEYFKQRFTLKYMGNDVNESQIDGEWIGLFKVTKRGAKELQDVLQDLSKRSDFKSLRMSVLFNELVQRGNEIYVLHIRGNWLDLDDLSDLYKASEF